LAQRQGREGSEGADQAGDDDEPEIVILRDASVKL
jgi:hypothetical protein